MIKLSYRDLLFVFVLTVASVAWLNIPILNTYPFNNIPYFLLLLFLSGYSLLAVLKPLIYRISLFRRVIYSIVLSFLLTVSVSLFSVFNTTSIAMFVLIPVLTLILILIAFIRRRNAFRSNVLNRIKKESGFDEKRILLEREDLGEKLIDKLELEVSRSKIDDQVKVESDGKDKPINIDNRNMKIGSGFYAWDLVLVGFLTLLSIIFILLPVLSRTVPRTVFGLFLVIFLPGYAIIASLFPKKGDLDGVERLTLSFGLSIVITPLIGLVLNYTSYGIRLDPILLSLSSLTVLLILVAYLRRRLTASDSRFRVDFGGFFKTLGAGFSKESRTGKVLSVILVLSILVAVSATVYVVVEPKAGESFTEFYILGPGGMASDYPTNLSSGENGSLIIGIVDHENKKASYHLVVTSGGIVQMDEIVNLNNQQSIMIPLNFTAGDPGSREMVFNLYKLPADNNVYRSLHLWLNISASSTSSGSSNLTSSGLAGNGTG